VDLLRLILRLQRKPGLQQRRLQRMRMQWMHLVGGGSMSLVANGGIAQREKRRWKLVSSYWLVMFLSVANGFNRSLI
jgi:hypothetical protein